MSSLTCSPSQDDGGSGGGDTLMIFHWSKLPVDLEVDILCRLPEKYLIQFKCVSKSFYFLVSRVCIPKLSVPAPLTGVFYKRVKVSVDYHIGDIHYGEEFMHYASWYEDKGVAVNDDKFLHSLSKIVPFQLTPDAIQDCCNGILLVSNGPELYYVCNPATYQWIRIPVNPNQPSTFYASLAFEPCNSGDFMIVCFYDTTSPAPCISSTLKLDVFSSFANKWVNHTVSVGQDIDVSERFKRSIYLNGILYTLSLPNYLICFDLKEVYVKARAIKLPEWGVRFPKPPVIPLPRGSPLKPCRINLLGSIGVSKGFLCYSNQFDSIIRVWSFQGSCNGLDQWVLKQTIDVDRLLWPTILRNCIFDCHRVRCFKTYWKFVPCALHPFSDVCFLGNNKMLFTYHPGINKLKVVASFERCINVSSCKSHIFPYSRCLIVLNDLCQKHR